MTHQDGSAVADIAAASQAALTRAEDEVADEVADVLTDVADEFTDQLQGATELVAAIFSVSSIARMFRQRVPRLVARLLGVAQTAAAQTADGLDAPLPDGWDDLPGQYEDGAPLPAGMGQYVTATEALLAAVGTRIAGAARDELAAGLDAGESVPQLRDRLRAAFAREGAALGDSREAAIAQTEVTRAWNAGVLAAARALTGPDRPLAKQWVTREDERVRPTHRDADGQLRFLDRPFTVGGASLMAPGDPAAPPSETVRCRCRLAILPGDATAAYDPEEGTLMDDQPADYPPAGRGAAMPTRGWSTPGDTALAFEGAETGDGRIFAAGALHWDTGPWPLQYADEMLVGHEGAELAGAIQQMGRDGHRITATGVLYSGRAAGADAAALLDAEAPLGVSVDLDDVDVEFIDRTGDVPVLSASLPSASMIGMSDGACMLTAHTAPAWTASGTAFSRTRTSAQLITGPGGTLPAAAVHQALAGTGALTAAAGDPDTGDTGTVVHAERSGELLMRITRGRVRGATLVAVPAFDQARIVLDAPDTADIGQPTTAEELDLAAASDTHRAVVTHVTGSPVPVRARDIAQVLGLTLEQARGHLVRAVEEGLIVRLAPGQYVGASTIPEGPEATAALSAAVSGDLDLPVHPDRNAEWDGDAAASRVLAWATGDDGEVDADRLSRAFLYRDSERDPGTLAAYKLGFADIRDGNLVVIARGVFAVAAALQGARGGVDVPDSERDDLRDRTEDLYARLRDAFDDSSLRAPWDTGDASAVQDEEDRMGELEASAWSEIRQAPPMPAEWFREPTLEELPPGSGGVHYAGGRIYGWVAQAGEPHAGMPGRNVTIESLGDIDLTHFLRARFTLDDGSTVPAGAFTMNAPHHRDGAECETSSCQFDDSRTVAGIVTVGLNSRGMWFSGAASPHMSDWDRQVFQACQPSYHMRQGRDGRWQLRAVLSVPVPGHSSPLVAAVVERSNLALAASAAVATRDGRDAAGDDRTPLDTGAQDTTAPAALPALDLDALTAALTAPAVLDRFADALDRRRAERDAETRAEIERLRASIAPARDLTTSMNGTKGGSAESHAA